MKSSLLIKLVILSLLFMENCTSPTPLSGSVRPAEDDSFLTGLLSGDPFLDFIARQKNELGVQVVYTRIDRQKNGKARFTDHYFNVNTGTYFYPASTVKFPVAVLALQKLNELKITGLDKYSTMITGVAGEKQTEVCNDPSAADGRPTVAHYIKKILLVSDNDAFNRLYEFLGQEYINNSLQQVGYTDVQIIHRLSTSLPDAENRFTNPVTFMDTSGRIIYQQPAQKSKLVYAERNTRMGTGYMQGGKRVDEPFDFSQKNRLSLPALHAIVRSIMFPGSVPANQRFNLTKEDYDFLRRYMSMRPGESVSPVYSPKDYWDNYVKMIYYGAEKSAPDTTIRVFNKTGTAYGFLIDAAYVADFSNNIEFMVSAVIYCNSDGIFNDDQYDYEKIGYPFFKQLGRILYAYELKRQKKQQPDLSSFHYLYR